MLKLTVSGYFPKRTSRERALSAYVKSKAECLAPHKRIKRVQVTFMKHKADYGNGFRWLVNGDTVEIVIPKGFKELRSAKWLVRHELYHACQILEKRLNKCLDRVVFINRKGVRRTYVLKHSEKSVYGMYVCLETGKNFHNYQPWEEEVRRDDKGSR